LCYAISAGYARIVSIAKAKVGFIEPMLAVAVIEAVRGRRLVVRGSDQIRVCSLAHESGGRRREPIEGGVNMVSSFVGVVPIGMIIDAILFGSALLAIAAARFLPEHHLSPETKGVVTVSAAIVGTLSALVVGLLISTSSASFTAKSQQVTQISANVISLDRMLRRYGPEPTSGLAAAGAIADRADLHARRSLGIGGVHCCARSGGCGAV
jgi:hypothetical protein